jgi:hypothetical protein
MTGTEPLGKQPLRVSVVTHMAESGWGIAVAAQCRDLDVRSSNFFITLARRRRP